MRDGDDRAPEALPFRARADIKDQRQRVACLPSQGVGRGESDRPPRSPSGDPMTASHAPVRNWAGNLTYASPRIHRPTSPAELSTLVRNTPRIRALGSGHSFSRIADSGHDLVRVDALPQEIEVDPAPSTVTVSAGTRYAELAVALHEQGYALASLASLPHISVAGSCATGTHGSGDGLRCLSAAVRGLEIIGPDGEPKWLRR